MRSRQAGQTTGSTRCESVVQEVVGQIWFARSESGGSVSSGPGNPSSASSARQSWNRARAVGPSGVGDCEPCHGLGTTLIRSRMDWNRGHSEMWFPGQRVFRRRQFPRVRRHLKWAVGHPSKVAGWRHKMSQVPTDLLRKRLSQELEVRVPDIIDALAVDLERPQSSIGVDGWRSPDTGGRRGHSDHATSRRTIAHVGG